MSVELIIGEPLRAIVKGDFEDTYHKQLGIDAVELFTAGSSSPADREPHPFDPVEKVLTADTTPAAFVGFMEKCKIAVVVTS